MSESFPRLLVATEFPPNSPGGGPAVVRQMLKGWPAEKLFWWSCLPDRDQRSGQQTASHLVAAIPARLYPNRRLARQKSWLLENVWTPWAARHLRHALSTIRPEAMWVIPHAWAIAPLARGLRAARVAFHVTVQDYMDTRNREAQFGAARCRRLAGLAEQLYARAATRDATSHPMITDLQQRTGCAAAQMLHAGLEESDFAHLAQPPRAIAGSLRIAYAGTIVVEDAFTLFVRALSRARERLPWPVTLEFFTGHSYRKREWFDPAWMRESGNLPEEQLTRALRECSWGFAPMALDDDDPRYNRFSFPTKFISYLAAGLPVITLGHARSSVAQMAAAYGVGPCVTAGDREALVEVLVAALARADAAAVYRPAILRCAAAEFDARRMRIVLRECFQKCAQLNATSTLH